MPEVRRAEVIGVLSLATDLGTGQPLEKELRSCLLATGLGAALGLEGDDLRDVYETSLLRWIGCTADAHELSAWFDDDNAARARASAMDFGRPLEPVTDLLRNAGAGRPPAARARAVAGALASGRRGIGRLFRTSCEAAERLAPRLGCSAGVSAALGHAFERWDGRGWPEGLRGDAVPVAVQVAQLAADAEVAHRAGGPAAAVALVAARAGSAYAPAIAGTFRAESDALLRTLETTSAWSAALDAEPAPRRLLDGEGLVEALAAIAEFADLKSPWTAGHSVAVADLAASAAQAAGLPEADRVALRRAGLVHDLGRVALPAGIWDKPGPLTAAEWERVRMHPYFTERMFARSEALAPIGSLAALHHERLDGSGYHRGTTTLGMPARLLAAADCYAAMRAPRPHRPARDPGDAESAIRSEVFAGRLDGVAVESVLAAAGHRPRRRIERPGGLTAREVEVVRLAARGLPNAEIARRLVISPRTVGHHLHHAYGKLGVTTRAAASLEAQRLGLIDPLER